MDHFDWSIFESGPLWAMDRIPSSRNQFQILKLMVLYLWKCSFNHLSQLTPNSLPITPRGENHLISYRDHLQEAFSKYALLIKDHKVSKDLLKLTIEIYILALGNLPLNISLNRTVVLPSVDITPQSTVRENLTLTCATLHSQLQNCP